MVKYCPECRGTKVIATMGGMTTECIQCAGKGFVLDSDKTIPPPQNYKELRSDKVIPINDGNVFDPPKPVALKRGGKPRVIK